MTLFRYKAYNADGAVMQGSLDTLSRAAAMEALHRSGLHAFELDDAIAAPSAPSWWNRELFASQGMPLAGLAVFTRELASLVRADLPLDETLRIVSLQPLIPKRMRVATQIILEKVRAGSSLSAAMAADGGFPQYYWRLIEAGETSGALDEVLDDLAALIERTVEMRAQVASALIYPAVLLFAALVTVGIVVSVLVPAVLPLFEDAGATPPLALRMLAELHDFVVTSWTLLLLGGGALAAGLYALWRNEVVRGHLDRAILRLPVLGRYIANHETARFTRTLGTMTRNGVPLLDGVGVARAVLRNHAFRSAVEAAGETIAQGSTLARPLEASGLVSELALRLISVGEQTGHLDAMLLRVAAIYEATVQRQMTRFVTLLTPMLTLLVGLVVGTLILSVMGAILSVNELAVR